MAQEPVAQEAPAPAPPAETPTPVDPADFVKGGEQVAQVDVRIAYGIIDRFSEGLYSSPNKAFEELVSNSYDAGAHSVWVYVPKVVKAGDVLAVIDDGASMDLAGLEALWEIGVSHKREDGAPTPDGRAPIGKFGIGKLATYVLGEKLTYICRADEKYLAVTMDYGKAKGGMSDPKPMSLHVVELSEEDAKETLETAIGDTDGVKALFGEKSPDTWTAAILSDLKPKAESIQEGRLRWILRTGLPVGDTFKLWFNDDKIASPREDGDRDWEFVVGETDADLPDWPYADKVGKDDQDRPGVELEEAGFIRGKAELFTDHLTKGKSEGRGRSHGFFVKVRERLVNFDDESFGIDVELSHGVLARFRMEVFADGLDPHISSPRESIQDSPALEEVRNYLKSVFNRARTARAKKEEKGDTDLLAAAKRIAAPSPALTTAPLRRVLKRAIESDDDRLQSMMGLETEERRKNAGKVLDEGETLLSEVLVEPFTHEKPLVSYDVERQAVIVNSDHPFVSNYLDQHGAAEPLRLVGASEFLTQIYMLDEDMSPALVHKILNRRDEFLRALVNIHPRSAVVIARQLRESKENRHELEDAVADGLELLGFEVARISGAGKPDGIARARLGARGVGSETTDYAVTYDSKSSAKDAIKAATTGTQTLRKHRKAYEADYSLVVAPGFQGGDDEESSIAENCTQDEVTPISIDDLARLIELFPVRALTPESLRDLFKCHLPKETAEYVQRVEEQDEVAPPPIAQILQITRDMSDREDAVDISALSTALRLQYKIELLARPPEIGPPCLRVLPARDNGQRRTEAGEEAKTQPRADHPQAADRRADALGGKDRRGGREGAGGLRADPAPLAQPVRRHEGRRRQAAEGAGERERPAQTPGRRQGAGKPGAEGDRQGKLLSPSRRRQAVRMLVDRLGLSERRACRFAGQNRSTQRHCPQVAQDDQALRKRLRKLSTDHPRWGYRRAHGHLLTEGWSLNRKRVQRIWREEGLRVPAKAKKRRRLGESTASSNRLKAERPNHVWALDFQHDATDDGRELKFLNVVDEFTREALAIEVDRSIDAEETVAVLRRLAGARGAPANLRADNGPELTAAVLREWCRLGETGTAYIEPGSPWQNPYVESFNARLRDELLNVEVFTCLDEARVLAADWRTDYNANHPHSALGMMSPARFAASWQRIGNTNGSVNPGLSLGVDR